ncbi:MAG: cytochrome d ubiquinol oxidase subunit II [Spirochaetia bacterium]|jgi:cytochrome d ubiquinol oxidase subunit II|nr:cytochrome d ubiquinol oxidase subunit II [Spirochaetia bacterium]
METLQILQIIWFLLIGVLFVGYSVLDGFDLGVGSLFPFLAKTKEEKQNLFDIIWPFWDGNEVWLLTAGGALFAAFPYAYATVFSGFYLALMLVLFALIFRAVSLEFWIHDEKRQSLWANAFTVGSFLPSLLYGVALGNVIVGIPLDTNMDFTGTFFTLLRPYPLSIGLLGLAAILLQGSTYTALKADGTIKERARLLTGKIWIFYIVTFVLSIVMTAVFAPKNFSNIPAWIFFVVVLAGTFLSRRASSEGSDLKAFLLSSLSFIGLWGITGAIQYPNLVVNNTGGGNITIFNGSSTSLTLTVMLIIAVIGVPIVLGYTIYVYRVFKGKIKNLNY